MSEVVLPRRVVQQPTPALYEEGDCTACVLAGLLNLPIDEIYQRFMDGEHRPMAWTIMHRALWEARAEGLIDRLVDEIPTWQVRTPHRFWGSPSWAGWGRWFDYVCMAIEAGYYAVAFVRFDRDGPPSDPDHAVLICGVREYEIPHPTMEEASVIEKELLISCSSTKSDDEEWVSADEFLKQRGGYNVLLARPSP